MERRTTRLGSNKMRLSDAPSRRLKTLVRSSGDLADPVGSLSTAFSRRSPVPVQPDHSGRPLFKGRTETQGLPGACLRGTSPGAASTFGLPLRPALALPRFRTPHEAPLTGQDASRIRQVWGTGIRNAKKFFSQCLQPRRVGKGVS